ncbi:MAG: F0F1 ATP synthase subunit B [Actinobacteria bacterium]|nr:F0F1 ATP synthase subunit B [Actinomycetota bacterium]MBI3256521.1 F0F1 ATP synthase subunit B [Actinomycetota bacterium]
MRTKVLLSGAVVAGAILVGIPGVAHASGSAEEQECLLEQVHVAEEIAAGDTHAEIKTCEEAPNPILPAVDEMVWGTLAFLVVFFGIAKFGYPAIKKGMDDRTARIAGDLDAADKAKVDAETVRNEYERRLADAKNEASRIIEEARQAADGVRRDLIARAEAEAEELRRRNAEAVAGERGRVMAEMQGQVASLAIELAEKVVEASLDREANLQLIENYINSVGQQRA